MPLAIFSCCSSEQGKRQLNETNWRRARLARESGSNNNLPNICIYLDMLANYTRSLGQTMPKNRSSSTSSTLAHARLFCHYIWTLYTSEQTDRQTAEDGRPNTAAASKCVRPKAGERSRYSSVCLSVSSFFFVRRQAAAVLNLHQRSKESLEKEKEKSKDFLKIVARLFVRQ